MRDVNKEIRTLLRGILVNAVIGCEVYNKQVPIGANDMVYCLIQTQQNANDSNVNGFQVVHLITFQIVEKIGLTPNTINIDNVADNILEALFTEQKIIDDNIGEIIRFALENDITLDGLSDGTYKVAQRTLTFSLTIKFK